MHADAESMLFDDNYNVFQKGYVSEELVLQKVEVRRDVTFDLMKKH